MPPTGLPTSSPSGPHYLSCTGFVTFVLTRRAIRYSVNSNSTELEQVVQTHRTTSRNNWLTVKWKEPNRPQRPNRPQFLEGQFGSCWAVLDRKSQNSSRWYQQAICTKRSSDIVFMKMKVIWFFLQNSISGSYLRENNSDLVFQTHTIFLKWVSS